MHLRKPGPLALLQVLPLASLALLALLVLLVSLLPTCAAPPDRQPGQKAWNGEPPPGSVRQTLDPGIRLRLLPLQVTTTGSRVAPVPRIWVNALFREAMVQSARFDVAAGLEDCEASHAVGLHLDPVAGKLTTTLEREGQAPLGLSAVSTTPGELDRALDRALDDLALQTRWALGEELRIQPLPCAQAYSASEACVRLTEQGAQLAAQGQAIPALRLLRRAREQDGGCTLTLMHLAAALLDGQGPRGLAEASATSREALRLAHRLTPRRRHRLARIHWTGAQDDQRLLALGLAMRRERPHDPHGLYSEALARNKMGQAKEALPLLEELARRWPGNGRVRYQLGYAYLARGRPEDALEALEEAGESLPASVIARPYAMALFHCGKHDELRRHLQRLAGRPDVQADRALHELRRMQAAHAILTQDQKEAVRLLLLDLEWMRQRPSLLQTLSLEAAEEGEVLARLGEHEALLRAIEAFGQLGNLPPAFANALAFLGGLVRIGRRQHPGAALDTLGNAGHEIWQLKLLAATHHRRGELQGESQALSRAVGGSEDPLVLASFARVLEAAGQKQDAKRLVQRLRSLLVSFDQRLPRSHPLMSPGRALAYLAVQD